MSGNLKPFPKGVSGNPGGRTKQDLEVEAFAHLHAKAAMQVLIDQMTQAASTADRINAASKVLERAFGKPREHQTIAYERPLNEQSDAELALIIAESAGSNGTAKAQASSKVPDRVH